MNAKCARCSKTVYPVEKLSCLDKTWHKGCFNCEVCQLKLTMKTYKGYNKLPYCNTHYPTTKFTSVADTPENLRLKTQTKNQSQVEYQSQFKDSLKQFSAVADNPENARVKMVQQQASQAAYTQGQSAAAEPRRPSYGSQPASAGRPSYSSQPASAAMPPSQPPIQAPVSMPPPQMQQQAAPAPKAVGKKRWRALYDYTAADEDEASFNEGDFIMDVDVIDEGWIQGAVQRTGESGMMPRNYFEEV